MPLPTSATRRLYDFLGRFHQAGSSRPGEQIEIILGIVLNDEKLDARHALRFYCDLIDLTDRSLAEIRAVFPAGEDPDHQRELSDLEQPVSSLRATLISNSPKSAAKTLLQHSPDRMQSLAATTSRAVGQRDPSVADLEEAADKLREALREFLAADVPVALKDTFRQGVERLLRMIDQYAIFGAEGIFRSVGELTGEICVRPESREPEARASVFRGLNRIADAVTIFAGSAQLGLLARPLVQGLLGG